MIRRLVGWALVLVVLGGALVAGRAVVLRRRQLAAAPAFAGRSVPVSVVMVARRRVEEVRSLTAVVAPGRRAELSSRGTAVVTGVLVHEGERVAAGDALVALDDRELRARERAERAGLARLEAERAGLDAKVTSLERSRLFWSREAGRDETLAAAGDVPRSQAEATAERLTEVEGRLAAARSERVALDARRAGQVALLDAVLAGVADASIRAPFAGVVGARFADPGDLARPGVSLVVVHDESLRLEMDLAGEDASSVATGSRVHVLPAGRERFDVVVTRRHPDLDGMGRQRVEAELTRGEAAGLPVGTPVPVELVLGESIDGVAVPLEAIVPLPGGGSNVFVVREDRLERRSVRVVVRGLGLAVVEGLNEGEAVVLSSWMAWSALSDGLKVEVTP